MVIVQLIVRRLEIREVLGLIPAANHPDSPFQGFSLSHIRPMPGRYLKKLSWSSLSLTIYRTEPLMYKGHT